MTLFSRIMYAGGDNYDTVIDNNDDDYGNNYGGDDGDDDNNIVEFSSQNVDEVRKLSCLLFILQSTK